MNKKEILKTVSIIILVIVIILLIIPGEYTKVSENSFAKGYNDGYIDGQIALINKQSETGNIFLVYNNSIEQFALRALCSLGVSNNG
ncbi:hypothetical protein LCGC14_1858430 [marine sediment metagenome]|uniref:Uncharacterized protein n=1 Tax=marine sediment metagenome TaxID=412755 RepID=A0A0F9G8H0_9ZZZZ